MKLLSIIIPVYNTSMYLHACLDSVFNQYDESLEVIIVNDGSTDKSIDIINEYEEKYRFVNINKANGGLSSARNSGLSVASGKYIAFLDSDDMWTDGIYDVIKGKLLRHNPDCLSFSYISVDADGDPISAQEGIGNISAQEDDFILNNPISVFKKSDWFAWRFIYKKTLFSHVCFDEGRRFEDQLIIPILIARSKKIIDTRVPIIKYRKNSSGITSNLRLSDLNDSEFGILRYIRIYYLAKSKKQWAILLSKLYISHVSKCARLYHEDAILAKESCFYISRIIPSRVFAAGEIKPLLYYAFRKTLFARLTKAVEKEVFKINKTS
ncbi:glycosyltransferase [Edwardsiella piscicida]|uniref:glycosyltransferase family 2 protein n=1 Tax=Edwardsiella piscicida TaxID=1263550 RepID=UPI00370D48B0